MSDAALARRTLLANLALLATATFWGTHIPAAWFVLARYTAFEVIVGRYCLAVPLLVLLLAIETRATGARPEPTPIGRLWMLGGVGILGFAIFYTVGLSIAGQIQGSLISAASPAVGVLVAWALKGVRPDGPMQLALVVALVGAVIGIAGGHDLAHMSIPGLGEAMMIFGNVMWSWYSLAAQDWLKGWSQIRVAAWSIAMAALTAFVLGGTLVALGLARVPPLPDLADSLVLAYLVVAPTILGLLGWNYGVRVLGLSVSSLYLNLVPVTAVLTAILLGDAPNLWQLAGGLLIIAGIAQAQVRRLDRA
ncbi:MAG: DMT family transporter [Alphaproteobacteria bacterium]|nr:DMT family transporter [Alphaproteobacteria bacterium]